MALKPVFDFAGDSLNKWVFEHQNFIPFLQISSQPSKLNSKNLDSTRKKLQNFYINVVLPAKPAKLMIPKTNRASTQRSSFLAHIHFFLQNQIYAEKMRSYEETSVAVQELLLELDKLKEKTDKIFIDFDDHKMMWTLFEDSPNTKRLISKDSTVVTEITADEPTILDKMMQVKYMKTALFNMSPYFDEKNFILHENAVQEMFEQLIFSDSFMFSDQIALLLTPSQYTTPQAFSEQCMSILHEIVDSIEVTDDNYRIMITIAFFRAIFNNAIPLKENFFFRNHSMDNEKESELNFRKIASKLTINDLGINKEFLSDLDEGDTLFDIASKNEKIMKSASYLMETAFATNPFDILSIIHLSLAELRSYAIESATEETKDQAYTFDCIFGLFLLALSVSDLPNVEEVFSFCIDFLPQQQLHGPNEYAKATVIATIQQCKKLIDKFT